jgi:hypothetical protein
VLLSLRRRLGTDTNPGPHVFIAVVRFISCWKFTPQFSRSFFIACSALARTVRAEHYILPGQKVPFATMSHSSALSAHANSSQNIGLVCYCFQMSWIYARAITTKMVYNQAFLDLTLVQKITKSVSVNFSLLACVHRSITCFVNKAWINTAFVRIAVLFEIPKNTFESEIVHV